MLFVSQNRSFSEEQAKTYLKMMEIGFLLELHKNTNLAMRESIASS